jgi:hypothetical protein
LLRCSLLRSEFSSLQIVLAISIFDLVQAGVLAACHCFTVLSTAKFRPLVISYLACWRCACASGHFRSSFFFPQPFLGLLFRQLGQTPWPFSSRDFSAWSLVHLLPCADFCLAESLSAESMICSFRGRSHGCRLTLVFCSFFRPVLQSH